MPQSCVRWGRGRWACHSGLLFSDVIRFHNSNIYTWIRTLRTSNRANVPYGQLLRNIPLNSIPEDASPASPSRQHGFPGWRSSRCTGVPNRSRRRRPCRSCRGWRCRTWRRWCFWVAIQYDFKRAPKVPKKGPKGMFKLWALLSTQNRAWKWARKDSWGLLHKIVCFETYLPLPVGTHFEVGMFCITKFAYINVPTPQICTYR